MLDSFFKITERGSTVGREIRGGFVTFFTMAYIVALNPLIIGLAKDSTGKYLGGDGSHPNLAMVAAMTALMAGLLTILMGAVANFPLALATGLGLNTFVAVGIASRMTWADAMGLIVLEGIIITVLVLTGFRTAVFRAVPQQLKIAISVGIGLFIALITSTIVAIIVEKAFKIGPNFDGATGKVNPKGWGLNVPTLPSKIVAKPDFGLFGHFSIFGGFHVAGITIISAVLLVFTLLLSDFFDTVGTVTAIATEAKLIDAQGTIPNNNKILIVDSLAAAMGGVGSISSNTSYIESASGVGEGARTGLASVVTGILFLLSTFLAPLVAVIPYEAATPALVIVGFLMMSQIKEVEWSDYGIGIPAFLTIILMPFTYSISVGIGAGFISHVLVRLVQGRGKEVHALLYVVSGLFVIYFLQSPISVWIAK